MIERLLLAIGEGGVHTYDTLAERMSVPQPLLEMMLEDLARLGYLREASDGCEDSCSHCSGGGCSIAGPGRLWALTEKGAAAAVRMAR